MKAESFPWTLLLSLSCASLSSASSHAHSAHSFTDRSLGKISSLVKRATQTASDGDVQALSTRRIENIVLNAENVTDVTSWLSTLSTTGQWPDVDYTSGCDAQRANWPAYRHWDRIVTLAAAWNGGLGDANAAQYAHNNDTQKSVSTAMDWWFANDFQNIACLDSGGKGDCPCGTPGLWNTNWFSSIILVPKLVGQACLILNSTLTPTQYANCTHMTGRAYNIFNYATIVGISGGLTGANALDVASIGVDLGLITRNGTLLDEAYARAHGQLVVNQTVSADGIRPDGAFGQHKGIVYNGNYGKDFTNDVLNLETMAGTTKYTAGSEQRSAFATLMEGTQWMIYRNIYTGFLHYDFSVIGRFIAFPTADILQVPHDIHFNVTTVKELGNMWKSDSLVKVGDTLTTNTSHANVGNMVGNRMYYTSDYMVHRGPGYMTSVKMFSKRTENSECTNDANPLGFHSSDGALYTYLKGNEYEDISAAWDWNLMPGTTVDYGGTPLNCNNTGAKGITSFVGGVSDGQVGIAAMQFTNPLTHALRWQKAWFFLDGDVQHVMVNNVSTNGTAEVLSVLDQRWHLGDILVDGKVTGQAEFDNATTLWHAGTGYKFPSLGPALGLGVQVGEHTGSWSAISTSTQPPTTVDLFSAYIKHKDIAGGNASRTSAAEYTVFPAVDKDAFQDKANMLSLHTMRNDVNASALFDTAHLTAMAVFWSPEGGSVDFKDAHGRNVALTITADAGSAVIYRMDKDTVTVADPSQNTNLTHLHVTLSMTWGDKPGPSKNLTFDMPSGGKAGSSVTQNVRIF